MIARGDLFLLPGESEPEDDGALDAQVVEDAKILGIDPEEYRRVAIESGEIPAPSTPERFVLWPENVPAFEHYIALLGQWRYLQGGLGPPQRMALDYAAVRAHLALTVRDADREAEVFADLRIMERAAISEISKAAAKRASAARSTTVSAG